MTRESERERETKVHYYNVLRQTRVINNRAMKTCYDLSRSELCGRRAT
jgi:hypothetical protein